MLCGLKKVNERCAGLSWLLLRVPVPAVRYEGASTQIGTHLLQQKLVGLGPTIAFNDAVLLPRDEEKRLVYLAACAPEGAPSDLEVSVHAAVVVQPPAEPRRAEGVHEAIKGVSWHPGRQMPGGIGGSHAIAEAPSRALGILAPRFRQLHGFDFRGRRGPSQVHCQEEALHIRFILVFRRAAACCWVFRWPRRAVRLKLVVVEDVVEVVAELLGELIDGCYQQTHGGRAHNTEPGKGLRMETAQVPHQLAAPIMAHQRIARLAQNLQQAQHVFGDFEAIEVLHVFRGIGTPEAPEIRGHRVVPRLGQRHQLVPPTVPKLRPPVQQQHQRSSGLQRQSRIWGPLPNSKPCGRKTKRIKNTSFWFPLETKLSNSVAPRI